MLNSEMTYDEWEKQQQTYDGTVVPDEIPQKSEAIKANHNPKLIQALKDGKVPMEYLPYSMFALDAAVHKHGADKYGERNWREDHIKASTYEGAMMRHLLAWAMGEDLDPDSGKPHLTHLRACCAVVLDSQMHGTMIDDRSRCESKAVSYVELSKTETG